MKAVNASLKTIDVDALRVGMFVHLDVGWMSHPFPRGRFRIASDDQIETIRALGLSQVQWSPTQSDQLASLPEDSSATVASKQAEAMPSEPTVSVAWAATSREADNSPEILSRQAHRRALDAQRQSQMACEKQFAQAAHECMELTALATLQPLAACQRAEQLAKVLVGQMAGKHDMCIRLLTQAAGDKVGLHAMNVTVTSLLMGHVFGFSVDEMEELCIGAMLHDIGKLELPDRVRHREDHFTHAEQRLYEDHVSKGVACARKMGLSAGATLIIAQHHEHTDGSGFPLRLTNERMSLAARIVALVNRYDNLCNPHVAARALTPHESISLLFAQGQSKFDTSILNSFIRMMGVYPAGSTVQLTDDRYALVVGVNSSRPLKPRVLVHDASVPRDEALVIDLETTRGLGIRRSLKPGQLPPSAFQYLAPRPKVLYFFEPKPHDLEAGA